MKMGNGVRNLFLVVRYVVTEGGRLSSPRRRDVTRPIVHTADAIQNVKFSAATNAPAIAGVGSAAGIPVEIRKPVTIRKLARETPNTAPMPNIRLMIPEANPMRCLSYAPLALYFGSAVSQARLSTLLSSVTGCLLSVP